MLYLLVWLYVQKERHQRVGNHIFISRVLLQKIPSIGLDPPLCVAGAFILSHFSSTQSWSKWSWSQDVKPSLQTSSLQSINNATWPPESIDSWMKTPKSCKNAFLGDLKSLVASTYLWYWQWVVLSPGSLEKHGWYVLITLSVTPCLPLYIVQHQRPKPVSSCSISATLWNSNI